MTSPGDLRIRLRLVVDPGVFVSALISHAGPPAKLFRAAIAGRVTFVISPQLLSELTDVLHRPKFRRWFSDGDADDLIAAVTLLGEMQLDPSRAGRKPVCRDPDDEYLIALAEDTDPSFLVSGDGDLRDVKSGTVLMRTARETVEILDHEHPWGSAFAPAHDDEIERRTEAEGNNVVLDCAGTFLTVVEEPAFIQNLADLVTPEALAELRADLDRVRRLLSGRGFTTRPVYPAPDVAYVRWTRDPGQSVMVTQEVMVDAVIMTMQRRPELPRTGIAAVVDFGGWRVHAVGGGYFPVEQLPDAGG